MNAYVEQFLRQNGFGDRDILECKFAMTYMRDYMHGTDGHNRLFILGRLIDLLERIRNAEVSLSDTGNHTADGT